MCIFLSQQQAPTSLATGRDGSMTSAAYSVADAKFRTDQNSSPVPSTMNQQVGLCVSMFRNWKVKLEARCTYFIICEQNSTLALWTLN